MARSTFGGLRSVGDRLARAGIASAEGRAQTPIERFATAWPTLVAPAAASKSWPHRLTRAGVLTIACADAGWAQELGAHAQSLAAGLATQVADVPLQRLRFIVADRAVNPSAGAVGDTKAPKPGRAHLALAEHAVEGVSDEALRSALKRAIAAALVLRERTVNRGDAGQR